MPARKRGRDELEAAEPAQVQGHVPSLLAQLRSMWEFSNIMQFIFIFGEALKIDKEFDIEDLEDECMKPEPSHKLVEIAFCLLKFISSQRGLKLEQFDEHASKQYERRAPERNPFNGGDSLQRFMDFDIFTKLRVLCQLSQWVFCYPDRLRERMTETKESEQIQWRIEVIGWDSADRSYYVLDDNRLYRQTDTVLSPSPPPDSKAKSKAKPKTKSKAKAPAKIPRAGTRSSKRRKTTDAEEAEEEEEAAAEMTPDVKQDEDTASEEYKWECVAVTLPDYQHFLDSIQKSRDPNEKALYRQIINQVMPVVEKHEESRQRKILRRQREIQAMEKMAHAKRSSRLAGKQEKAQQEAEIRAAEEKRTAELAAARKEEERLKKMGDDRESRMMTREQRLREREHKRILHEEELRKLAEDSEKLESGDARLSERHLKAEMARRQKELEELQEEEDWVFDCAKCGAYGENLDDGSHSIACDKCKVWQHSACLGISQTEAEKEDFGFVCDDCKRKAEDAQRPKIPSLKFKMPLTSSPPTNATHATAEKPGNAPETIGDGTSKKRKSSELEAIPGMPPMKKWKPPMSTQLNQSNGVSHTQIGGINGASMHQSIMNGPTLIPQGQQAPSHKSDGQRSPPPGLQSPTRPNSKSKPNGNGAPVGIFSSSMQSLTNGTKTNHPTLPAPSPNVGQRSSPPIQTTPHHSFNSDQRTPAPSQRSSFATPTNGASFHSSAASPVYLNSPSTNLPPSSSAAAPSLQPGFSPQKAMPSSPPPRTATSPKLHDRSSPMMAPPSTDLQAAGASPLKHEPPRPSSSHSIGQSPTIKPVQPLWPGTQPQQ